MSPKPKFVTHYRLTLRDKASYMIEHQFVGTLDQAQARLMEWLPDADLKLEPGTIRDVNTNGRSWLVQVSQPAEVIR